MFTIGVDDSNVKSSKGTTTIAIDGDFVMVGSPVVGIEIGNAGILPDDGAADGLFEGELAPIGIHPQFVATDVGKEGQRSGSTKPKIPASSNCPQVTSPWPGKGKMVRGFSTTSSEPQTAHAGNPGPSPIG